MELRLSSLCGKSDEAFCLPLNIFENILMSMLTGAIITKYLEKVQAFPLYFSFAHTYIQNTSFLNLIQLMGVVAEVIEEQCKIQHKSTKLLQHFLSTYKVKFLFNYNYKMLNYQWPNVQHYRSENV